MKLSSTPTGAGQTDRKSDVFRNIISFIIYITVGTYSFSVPHAFGVSGEIDIEINDGKIYQYTYQLLNLLKIDDDDGIRRIFNLDPPKFIDDEIEFFNSLRLWLTDKTPHGSEAFKFPLYPPFMIEKMRKGDGDYSATCGTFSVAYAGLLLAHDIPVRLIHVYRSSVNRGLTSHTFNEVWSEEYQKWIIQDLFFNLFWLDPNGIPANAIEIQREVSRCGNNMTCYQINPYISHGTKFPNGKIFPELFYRIVVAFRSNYFIGYKLPYLQYQIGALFHIKNRQQSVFDKVTETEDTDLNWKAYKEKFKIKTINDVAAMYAPINQIEISVEEKEDKYEFHLRNNIFNFNHYEIKEQSKEWGRLQNDTYFVLRKPITENVILQFRGISKGGHQTRAFDVKIIRKK